MGLVEVATVVGGFGADGHSAEEVALAAVEGEVGQGFVEA